MKKIHKTITITWTFHFSGVDEADVEKSIGNLNSPKVGTLKNMPTKCLKVTSDICSLFLTAIWNQELILNKEFPPKLKLADITPVYKKEDSTEEKIIDLFVFIYSIKDLRTINGKQISEYINQFLSSFLCGCWKGFSTQTASAWLIEKWKHQRDKNCFAGAILLDLSKAFDAINCNLLIVKLHAYGFGKNVLDLAYS